MDLILKIITIYLIIASPAYIIMLALCKASAKREKIEKELLNNFSNKEDK